ncbi:MAG: LysR family transcriptional regulator [Kangiellaceae bacterium]|jgi:LysR family transcriptional regulator, flagellar master operon regulator
MDIQLLKTFLEVKATRHFGRAAENLYLTQAAVSARIKQLETVLGTPLFTRYRNNLQLTSAGERLVEHAQTILLSWDRARADISLKKNQAHVLSLGATSGLWDLTLQKSLNLLHAELPQVALRAESHGQDVVIRRLMERTLDIGLVYEPAKLSELHSQEITQAQLVLVSSIQGDTVSNALNRNYVSVDWGTAFDINFGQTFHEVLPAVLYTTHARIALDFIHYHGGSAYLPLALVKSTLGKSLFLVENAATFNRPIFACQHVENRNTSLIEKAIAIIKDLE